MIQPHSKRFSRLFSVSKRNYDGHDAQFKAIREGIVHNSSRFDRLESDILGNRSAILKIRADITDFHEEIRQWKKAVTAQSTFELKK